MNIHLPKPVHAAVKSWCIRNGLTMQEGVMVLLEQSTRGEGLRLGPGATPGRWGEAPGLQARPSEVRVAAASAPRVIEEEPTPERLPLATLEEAKLGAITCDLFEIPLDWCDGDGRTRAQVIAAGEGDWEALSYEPPQEPARAAGPVRSTPAARHDPGEEAQNDPIEGPADPLEAALAIARAAVEGL